MSLTIIILIIVAVSVIGIGAFFLIKMLKDNLKLSLDKTSFSSGEIITGKITIKSSKDIKCNQLCVKLIGKRGLLTKTENDTTKTIWNEIYQDEVFIEGEKLFQKGTEQHFSFQINTPSKENFDIPNTDSEMLDNVVKVENVMQKPGRYKWEVEAILNAEGTNLNTKKEIIINISSNESKFF